MANENSNTLKEFNYKPQKTNSKMNKFWVIVMVLLVLLIPICLLYGIVSDRENYSNEAISEVTSSWGQEQYLNAPSLSIKNDKNEIRLPLKDYSADIKLKTEVRKRGIFKVPVYTAFVNLKGNFDNKYGSLAGKNLTLDFGVSDSIGFVQEPILKLNNENAVRLQNTEYNTRLNTTSKIIPFEISYQLRGAKSIDAEVTGERNNIQISGNWKNPSFKGSILPTERNVEKDIFSAEWSVPLIATCKINNPHVGTSLLMPINNYRMADRTLKYAFLFLSLTFLSYFIYEIISNDKTRRIHPLQYLMLGGGLLMFYLLLVSLSEYCSFALAYTIASIMIISLTATYTHFVITKCQNNKFTLAIISLLTGLYLFLYLLLSLQDLALLAGSCGLFIIIAIIMYVTRNIDWYSDN